MSAIAGTVAKSVTVADLKAAVLAFFAQHALWHDIGNDHTDGSYFSAFGVHADTSGTDTGWAIKLVAAEGTYGGIEFHADVMFNVGDEWKWVQQGLQDRKSYTISRNTKWIAGADFYESRFDRKEIDPEYLPAVQRTYDLHRQCWLRRHAIERDAAALRAQLGADEKGHFAGEGYTGKVGCGLDKAGVQFNAYVTDPAKIAAIRAILDGTA